MKPRELDFEEVSVGKWRATIYRKWDDEYFPFLHFSVQSKWVAVKLIVSETLRLPMYQDYCESDEAALTSAQRWFDGFVIGMMEDKG